MITTFFSQIEGCETVDIDMIENQESMVFDCVTQMPSSTTLIEDIGTYVF